MVIVSFPIAFPFLSLSSQKKSEGRGREGRKENGRRVEEVIGGGSVDSPQHQ